MKETESIKSTQFMEDFFLPAQIPLNLRVFRFGKVLIRGRAFVVLSEFCVSFDRSCLRNKK